MRIQYKGGVWKNSEDEILKAAVMKYGKNQWPRIASLLVRKSAKQCKARWFEWLDPAIKKTPWTREEEEKLLHLAKIMPTSWRTIAPMIGRTAAQCLEHYEKLLDDAQRAPGADGAGPSAAAGRPRPGEADPAPESKPARPDPVDMDDDELEMLSEARARLANTKGKKAKRKAREKQLEAAKRLAQLQKRRELKAAGVELKPRRKNRKVTDYATEIPFERAPVPGFYDTREEDDRVATEFSKKKQIGNLLQKYKGKSEQEEEEEARRKDDAKRKQLEKTNLPAALGLEQKSHAPKSPPLKKARLVLPEPQMSDIELEQIAKRGLPVAGTQPSTQPSGVTSVPSREPQQQTNSGGALVDSVASTPRTNAEPWAAVRQRQIETIINLKSMETPLRGGESTPLVGLGLESGVTPARSELRTPNPLATPSMASVASLSGPSASQLTGDHKKKLKAIRDKVKKGLDALPDPENEYQVDLDRADTLGNGINERHDRNEDFEEDADDERARKKAEQEQELKALKAQVLSSAAQKGLPVPIAKPGLPGDLESVDYIVAKDNEARQILDLGDRRGVAADVLIVQLKALSAKDTVDSFSLATARRLVTSQIRKDGEEASSVTRQIMETLMSKTYVDDCVIGPGGVPKPAATPSELEAVRSRANSIAAALVKAEKKQKEKQTVLFRGYQKKVDEAYADLNKLCEELSQERRQLSCFEALAAKEIDALPIRIRELREQVATESTVVKGLLEQNGPLAI